MKQTGDLLALAEAEGVTVGWADLHRRRGTYDDRRRAITLSTRLSVYQEVSTLAHELSHAGWRDRHPWTPAERTRIERRADVEAARLLVSVEDYAAAEVEVGSHPGALAEYLGVSLWVVEVWQREAGYGRAWTRRR